MEKECCKANESKEACYFVSITRNVDEGNECTDNEYSQWSFLPDILLEDIFSYLTVKERYYASLVCINWYKAFHLPPVWSNFIIDDRTLTRTKYNYYSGWQYILDNLRAHNCLTHVGKYIKGLEFRPQYSFNNLFQFMTLISWCMEKSKETEHHPELKEIGAKVKSLVYIFPCNVSQNENPEGIKLFGTGGQLLDALKKLMAKFTKLRILKLIDLVLERFEANHLLDEVLDSCCTILQVLHLVNVTIVHCPIMHIGLFLNLRTLVISPQNISDEILLLIGDSKLRDLHLLQNRYTPTYLALNACSAKNWKLVKKNNSSLRVHIRVESFQDGEILLQPQAPIYSVVYHCPKTKIQTENLLQIIENYKGTLSIFGYELLPKFISQKSFQNRIDNLILHFARHCCKITTLIIREKISTSTVLLIAYTAKNLRHFYIRRFGTIIRCDSPKNVEWSPEFFKWLKNSSKSYEATETEISKILGKKWNFLNDKDFKKIQINVKNCL